MGKGVGVKDVLGVKTNPAVPDRVAPPIGAVSFGRVCRSPLGA